MDKTDFKLGKLKVQLGQFSTNVDSKDVSIRKTIEILSDFGGKLLMTEVLKLAKFFLIICGALDLVPFVQFKKREKHLCRSVNFSKVTG